jgi:hypothetical protein
VKIQYEVTVDDLVAFAFYQSSRTLRQRGKGAIAWGAIATLGLIAVTTALMGMQAALVMFPLAAVPIFFIFGMLFKAGFRPNTWSTLRRQYEELLPREATGPHELELGDDGLVQRTPYSELRTPFRDVEGISSDGERTFIHIKPASAYVIPHRIVPEGELEAFVEAVRMKLSERSAVHEGAREQGGATVE